MPDPIAIPDPISYTSGNTDAVIGGGATLTFAPRMRAFRCKRGHTYQASYPWQVTVDGSTESATICPQCYVSMLREHCGAEEVTE